MTPKTERARTQIPGDRVTVLYDPALVRVCGGVAAALLFSWFEDLFANDGQLSRTHVEWARALGMRVNHFSQSFYLIGQGHRSSTAYQLARIAGREFWSVRYQREVFYSLEVTHYSGPCILRRNAKAIQRTFNGAPIQPVLPPNTSSKALAKSDSCRISVTTR